MPARNTLSSRDWIEASIEALLEKGPSGLKVASLARDLGVTPGSFYWHFRSRDELRDRVLQHWREHMLRGAASAGVLAGKGPEQIRGLSKILVARRLPALDGAMRAWGRDDPVVAEAVARADELRVRVVAGMLQEAGLDEGRARRRAQLLWWVFRGSEGADDADRLGAFRDLTEALLHDAG